MRLWKASMTGSEYSCLNHHGFRDLNEARTLIKQWQYHYNHERPYSSLGYLPPHYVCKTDGMICFIFPNRNGSDAGVRSIRVGKYQQAISNPLMMKS